MKKIVTGASAALLAGVLVFGSASFAGATEGEEAPVTPDETTSEVIEDVTPPAEEEVEVPVDEEVPTPTEEPVTEEPVVTIPEVKPETKTIKWILPDGGTSESVTWPQALFDETLVPCGTTVTLQVDTYVYTTDEEKALTDALDDDGLLQREEDYGLVLSWYFETFTADECVVVPPAPESKVDKRESSTLDCVADVATTTIEGRFSDPVYVEETNSWIDGPWSDWEVIESKGREATDEECPVVVPPVVEPPVVEPPVVQPPAIQPPVTAQVVAQQAKLADTGGSDMALWSLAGILTLLAGIVTLVTRRFVVSK